MKLSKRKYFSMIMLLMLVMVIWLPVKASAASHKLITMNEKNRGTKVGNAWFRSIDSYDKNDNWQGIAIQYSTKSATSGFKTIVKGKTVDGVFTTDGTTVYFIAGSRLRTYTIATKAIKTLRAFSRPTSTCYFDMNGLSGGKIWILCRDEKYTGHALYSYELSTKTVRKELKNFIAWNAAAASRFQVVTTGTKKPATEPGSRYNLQVFDKKTSKLKQIAKDVYTMTYASGGFGYSELGNWTMYGVYNKTYKQWSIYEYKFYTGEKILLKKLPKGAPLNTLLYVTGGAYYNTSKKGWDGSISSTTILKAK